jgi:hypothetical protein
VKLTDPELQNLRVQVEIQALGDPKYEPLVAALAELERHRVALRVIRDLMAEDNARAQERTHANE